MTMALSHCNTGHLKVTPMWKVHCSSATHGDMTHPINVLKFTLFSKVLQNASLLFTCGQTPLSLIKSSLESTGGIS